VCFSVLEFFTAIDAQWRKAISQRQRLVLLLKENRMTKYTGMEKDVMIVMFLLLSSSSVLVAAFCSCLLTEGRGRGILCLRGPRPGTFF
jgi:hypothetical protein